jgi:hypothetical protein
MKRLGPEWVEQDQKGLIKGTEEKAATELLKDLGGVSDSGQFKFPFDC